MPWLFIIAGLFLITASKGTAVTAPPRPVAVPSPGAALPTSQSAQNSSSLAAPAAKPLPVFTGSTKALNEIAFTPDTSGLVEPFNGYLTAALKQIHAFEAQPDSGLFTTSLEYFTQRAAVTSYIVAKQVAYQAAVKAGTLAALKTKAAAAALAGKLHLAESLDPEFGPDVLGGHFPYPSKTNGGGNYKFALVYPRAGLGHAWLWADPGALDYAAWEKSKIAAFKANPAIFTNLAASQLNQGKALLAKAQTAT